MADDPWDLKAELENVRADYAAQPGAEPCPVCGMKTPSVRSMPPCYVPYGTRRSDCLVFSMPYPEDFPVAPALGDQDPPASSRIEPQHRGE